VDQLGPPLGLGQDPAVHLAVRAEGQAVDYHERRASWAFGSAAMSSVSGASPEMTAGQQVLPASERPPLERDRLEAAGRSLAGYWQWNMHQASPREKIRIVRITPSPMSLIREFRYGPR